MDKDRRVFRWPKKENAKLWRYMSFAKFVALLETKSLWFSRASCFEDTHEGSAAAFTVLLREIAENPPRESDRPSHEFIRKHLEENPKLREVVYINCWHRNDIESVAMWKLYGGSEEAIAITTKFSKLLQLLPYDCKIGEVEYIDYDREARQDLTRPYGLFMSKRLSFAHEQEVRAMFYIDPNNAPGVVFSEQAEGKNRDFRTPLGYPQEIDVDKLVDEIYIAPTAPDWFEDLVKSICKKYDFKKEVSRSDIFRDPVY
nr:hypothetical protein [uncultured Cohaesibacter sp.]